MSSSSSIITAMTVDETAAHSGSGSSTEDDVKAESKQTKYLLLIECPVCHKKVRSRRLARHKKSQACRAAGLAAELATTASVSSSSPEPARESKTRAQHKKHQDKKLGPQRAFLDVPMVSAEGAMTTLHDFLLNVANVAVATGNDAVSCLRKIAGVRHPGESQLTLPQLYALLVDTEALQQFFKVLEKAGMKASSRKRYVDAVRLGLTWLQTRPPADEGNLPTGHCPLTTGH